MLVKRATSYTSIKHISGRGEAFANEFWPMVHLWMDWIPFRQAILCECLAPTHRLSTSHLDFSTSNPQRGTSQPGLAQIGRQSIAVAHLSIHRPEWEENRIFTVNFWSKWGILVMRRRF